MDRQEMEAILQEEVDRRLKERAELSNGGHIVEPKRGEIEAEVRQEVTRKIIASLNSETQKIGSS